MKLAINELMCVTYGTALEAGIDLDAVYRIVHADNMRKAAGGSFRSDGKLVKPEGYDRERVYAEVYEELRRQGLNPFKRKEDRGPEVHGS
jgi:predicted HAD superfamily Cof-like phosphohydrolase